VAAAALRNWDWPQALLFDCDGVLCDTERDGHRVNFNKAFVQMGVTADPELWGVEEYGELLRIGGGKERMTHYFTNSAPETPAWAGKSEEGRVEMVKALHKLKTELFLEQVAAGELALRPGVQRLVKEAFDADVKVAVCSTSNEKAVAGIVAMLGPAYADNIPIYAGDVVPRKKPDPAVYMLAAEELGVEAKRCVVVEDSNIGLRAAKAAGMRCVVTQSGYTADEDFSIADAVFPEIGDDGAEQFSLQELSQTYFDTA
jgi:HAD superfamily hydrolase (TIGR01509 family)